MHDSMFSQIDFGPVKAYLENDDVTDISYSNGGQIWLKTLSRGIFRIENPAVNNAFIEKLAFQCANAMGKTFNMAHPFLDAESAELRLNFVHDSVARNGVACVMRKTPAKIRLEKEKILADKYIELDIHEFLIKCIEGHCNIIVCGETGSGKTEFVKYLASKIKENEKVITIEDTLELHLDRIFPTRDIVAMKTNNIASYSDVLVTCMRQNPKWILLSEVRSAEAVMAVRNSISSGHYILSTIHADKAASIPNRMYSLLESNQDIEQFLASIYRYVQLGIYIRAYQDKVTKKFVREIAEVTEFYVTKDNKAEYNTIYRKTSEGNVIRNNPSPYLIDYLDSQGVSLPKNIINVNNQRTMVSGINTQPSATVQPVRPVSAVNPQAVASNQTNKVVTQNPAPARMPEINLSSPQMSKSVVQATATTNNSIVNNSVQNNQVVKTVPSVQVETAKPVNPIEVFEF